MTRGGAGPIGVFTVTYDVKFFRLASISEKWKLKRTIVPNVTKNIFMSHFAKSELTPVAVSKQVFHGVQALTKQPVSLPEFRTFMPACSTAVLYARAEGSANKCSRSIPSFVFGSNVVLHYRQPTL